jgi:L,D-transpeptidase YcbB
MRLSKSLLVKISAIIIFLAVAGFFIRRVVAREADKELLQNTIRDKILVKMQQNFSGERMFVANQVKSFYKYVNYNASWVKGDYVNFNAGILLNFLNEAEADGLVVRDYHRNRIRYLIPCLQRWLDADNADSLAEFDILLTDAFLSYAMDQSTGQFYAEGMNVNRDENLKLIPYNQWLRNGLDSQRLNITLRKFAPGTCRYNELKNALLKYEQIYASGGFVALPDTLATLQPGDQGSMVSNLMRYLSQTGDFPGKQRATGVYDDGVMDAVKHFQNRHGLPETGWINEKTSKAMQAPVEHRIAQITASMERLRWIPRDLGQKYIMVNTADFSMEINENFNTVMKMKIIVGLPYKQTPVFHANMKYAIINPYWDVPRSIATEEILPILKRNPGYISKNHMNVYTQGGAEINPYRVAWGRVTENNFSFKIRQVPGTWNALGAIKFLFPNSYNVYLHGTPHQNLFDKDVRTFSHGCMRVEYPMKMAVYILKENGWDQEAIEKQILRKEETWIVLKHEIPVYVTYRTAWINNSGNLCFRNDIYNRDDVFAQYIHKPGQKLNI